MRYSSLSSAATLLVGGAAAASCDYSKSKECINSTVQVEAEFKLEPLLPKPAKFVYAMDHYLIAPELNIEDGSVNEDFDPRVSVSAWWVEYDQDGGISFNNTDERVLIATQLLVMYTNVSRSTGGGNNGCDGLLGVSCVNKLKETLTDYYFEGPEPRDPFEALVSEKGWEKIGDACPKGMNEDSTEMRPKIDTLSWERSYFAIEAPPDASPFDTVPNDDEAMPSGNSSFTYFKSLPVQRPFSTQPNTGAVAVFLRGPVRFGAETNLDVDIKKGDVSVVLACAKASEEVIKDASAAADSESGSGGGNGGDGDDKGKGDGDEDGDGGEGAASVAGAPLGLVLVVLLGAMLCM